MPAHPIVAAVSDRRRRSEIDATIYVPPYSFVNRGSIHPIGSFTTAIFPGIAKIHPG